MISNFKEFLDYVMSFYGDADALYPIDGLTREEVALATLNYLDLCAVSDVVNWGDGDSLDRERVREFIISRRSTKPQLPVFT
jgi:hypothetical protein|tara:strand:- start:202 stop:447 length:246 start_codon:yes stop_codon:yes gene_type:complete